MTVCLISGIYVCISPLNSRHLAFARQVLCFSSMGFTISNTQARQGTLAARALGMLIIKRTALRMVKRIRQFRTSRDPPECKITGVIQRVLLRAKHSVRSLLLRKIQNL